MPSVKYEPNPADYVRAGVKARLDSEYLPLSLFPIQPPSHCVKNVAPHTLRPKYTTHTASKMYFPPDCVQNIPLHTLSPEHQVNPARYVRAGVEAPLDTGHLPPSLALRFNHTPTRTASKTSRVWLDVWVCVCVCPQYQGTTSPRSLRASRSGGIRHSCLRLDAGQHKLEASSGTLADMISARS